ncbi:hypothetical protein [Ruegeria sp. MALMAid1280]|uniref:hypothetical protein n=1 Tax=Ruegeria sp. MALMAid1280 TaxID=3411634 RepID=UPI003BA17D35
MKDVAPIQPAIVPAGRMFKGTDQRTPLRKGLKSCGEYGPGQTAGRFYPVACGALEVTQHCNLDCTLCYLSNRAEMTYDPPLSVLFARLATIRSHYGTGVSVQLTGGIRPCARSRTLRRCAARSGVWGCAPA